MSSVVLQKSVTVPGVTYGGHISHLTSDEVWVNDVHNLVLTNTAGKNLYHLTDIDSACGVHTVNSDGDLIYIDKKGNINKLSKVDKVKSAIIKYTESWKPQCVYSSHSSVDLLVVMWNADAYRGKVTRYNSALEHIQTIQYDDITGQELYIDPGYITENRNGDVIVSDHDREAVVVTDRGGRHRFSYTGHPSGSGLLPFGICTNVLSQILVCDYKNNTIHIICQDGNFLSFILTQEQGLYLPQSLSYDEKTHFLWVGSGNNNTVVIYKYIDGESLTGLHLHDIKCKRHPRRTLDQFCTQCNSPLCVDCTSSEDHSRHDLRNIEALFKEIHRIEDKDGDTLLMCLLLSNSYKIILKEGNWMTKYNAIANSFHSKEIKKPFAHKDLEKYKPILKFNELEISFSTELFKDISFLNFSKNSKFLDIFLAWAEKENIAEYCRSWNYRREEGEVCCWLLPEKNEEFLERLGENIFTHPTMNDQSIHEAVFRKFGVPMQVIMRGDNSVRNFMENLKKGRTMMYHASGMIIGCAGSGKTTLLERLKGTDLAEIKKKVNSTRGVEIHTDVFNVTDSIQVNPSRQQQRFKIGADETTDEKMQDKQEPVAVGCTAAEASYHKHVSPDEINIKTTSSYKRKDPTSSENAREVNKDDQAFPSSSELSGVLQIVSKNNSNDPEKKITMTDFAGQCAYYASHQIFLSPRAFFILVLDMEKRFDDKVGEEVCRQKGSIYNEWTHRDYLKFWMESIHQYSSIKAPVILICTHSEDKEKRDITLFFREIWKTLEIKKFLHEHLVVKRRVAVGFHDNECIEKIKKLIVDVVCTLDHWGEDLPQSWAMFEAFFRGKKEEKILNKNDILTFNNALPEGIKLRTIDDMNVMLQFFHDIREILYFDQDFLNKVIILDVQWFADAFKNVITDENHAEEDLFEFASEWDKFNETGELTDTLLSAIWKMNNNSYIEHKDSIMMYMERLGLLAKISDKKWYVPCMNKIPFPANYFSYPASSILCYKFDVFPAGIFHRLVAKCMQIPWEIFSDKDRGCIYQTASIFVFDDLHHNILIGLTQTEIQLQVFVAEGKVGVSICHQIRERIENELHNLSNTFHKNSEFQIAFKCKPTGFCDSKEGAVINESVFTRASFQCPSCPANKKHSVKTKDIIQYWKQVPEDETKTSKSQRGFKRVASSDIFENTESVELLTEVEETAEKLHRDLVVDLMTDYLDESVEERVPYVKWKQYLKRIYKGPKYQSTSLLEDFNKLESDRKLSVNNYGTLKGILKYVDHRALKLVEECEEKLKQLM